MTLQQFLENAAVCGHAAVKPANVLQTASWRHVTSASTEQRA
jgi:hypothetical protein